METTENKNEVPEERPVSLLNKEESGVGAVVASVIIILIIVVGAFYFFTLVRDRNINLSNNINKESTEAPTIEELNNQSDSDNIADIEADLEAEGFDDLDAEMDAIEAEFEAN